MHAKEPGPHFREDFDRYPNLIKSDLFERILYPVIADELMAVADEMRYLPFCESEEDS